MAGGVDGHRWRFLFDARGGSGQTCRMLKIDLTGKRAFVAGVADDGGFGFAIAKSLA